MAEFERLEAENAELRARLEVAEKRAALALLGEQLRDLPACGHLPHIDQPQAVVNTWLEISSP